MSRITESSHLEQELVVSRVTEESSGVVSLTLADPGGAPLPEWHPGAHIDLVLTEDLVRPYSLCGRTGEDTWRVGVLREPESRGGSVFVHERVREGDLIHVRGPRNNFPLVEAPSYLFIAGGIGVTPMLAMLRAVHERGASWRFLYGGRTRAGMAFVDEVLEHGDGVVLWPEDTHGFLPLREEIEELAPEAVVYCCGPEPLIAAVERVCADLGRPAPLVERFAPKTHDADETVGDRPFTVVVNSTGARYEVPADKTIIEVFEAVGINVESSCQEGVCGTCEKRIVSGTVDHRDSLLSEKEKAENEYMMICVSRATSEELVLDM
jgi:ferredoxin-NADP reductase